MEKIMLFQNDVTNEEDAVFHLEYSLLIRSAEVGEVYGAMIRKTDADSVAEEDFVDGLCESREEAEHFLCRLAEGLALPMELTALCDDFIFELETEEKQISAQEAS
ncbi:MAG: hypothetical protein IKK54_06260 [Anaerotignum sp.]|nr:hypothetical protein [Anaerotignum sp.]